MNSTFNESQILNYQADDGTTKLEVRLDDETVWLTLNQMAELFQVDKSGIRRHLKNIIATRELQPEATVANFATVQQEGLRAVSRRLAKVHAEYERYHREQLQETTRVELDFLEAVKKIDGGKLS